MVKIDKEDEARLERIKKSLLKQIAISAKYGFDVRKHWEDMQASLGEEPKTNLFDSIKGNPNLKKSKTDYGALTVKAMRRMK